MAGGRSLALRTVKAVAAAGDRVRRPGRGVVVLLYHRVGGGSGSEVDLSPPVFEEQIRWLAGSARVVRLDAAVDALDAARSGDGDGAPGRAVDDPVVVTFDDGTMDLADVATPILQRHAVPATVYLATRFIDEAIPFPDGGTPLSWSAVRDMASTGMVTFGSHTHGHRLLDRLPPAEAADELDRSRALIEDALATPVRHFAYPKAVAASALVEPLVRERYRSAALAGCRPNHYGATDVHRLSRTPVQVSDGTDHFVRKASGGMALEDSIRRAVNRVRYRAAVR